MLTNSTANTLVYLRSQIIYYNLGQEEKWQREASNVSSAARRLLKLKSRTQHLLKEYMDNLSIHGTKILTGSILERIFWALIYGGGLGYLFFTAHTLWVNFVNYDFITNNEFVEVGSIKLPSITVCDAMNFFCSSILYRNTSAPKYCDNLKMGVKTFNEKIFCWKNDNYTLENCNYKLSQYHPGCVTINPLQDIIQKVQGRHLMAEFAFQPNWQNGVHMFLHEKDEVPSWLDRYEYKTHTTGAYDVIITRTDFQRLSSPYRSNCSNANIPTSQRFPYSRSLCQQYCVAAHMLNTCGTLGDHWWQYMPSLVRGNVTKSNKNKTEESERYCVYESAFTFHKHCRCTTTCKETIYSAKLVQTNSKPAWIHLNFYYDKLQITKTTEFPAYNSVRFMADIGGLLGMLVGLNVLSMFEIVCCFLLLIIDLILKLLLKVY